MIVVVLTLFPIFYLLLFAATEGKKSIKAWWISSMTGFALGAVCYEVRGSGIHYSTVQCVCCEVGGSAPYIILRYPPGTLHHIALYR